MSSSEKLELLAQRIEQELVCPLKDAATNLVFGKGNPDADILFIGEAPGKEEDLQGKPFVGRAGQELDKFLRLIGLALDDVYIANILKYRPPNNRDPSTGEIENHTPYLIEQIRIIQPKVIVTLGNYSTKFVLGGFHVTGMKGVKGITQLHGQLQKVRFENLDLNVIPMYHPAAMLYNPRLRDSLEKDFLIMGAFLGLESQKVSGAQMSLHQFE